MVSENDVLSIEDVTKLMSNPSADNRAELADKISKQYDRGELSPDEHAIAEEIFQIMVRDAEVRVRKALAESLKSNPDLPHDLAKTLADDVAEVSLPIIEFSSVLTETDLIEIIEKNDGEKQSAIAKRENVPEAIADVLIETDNVEVIANLVANNGAQISESSMELVVDRHGENEKVNSRLAKRAHLPVHISERLVLMVSENIREHLVTHHELSADVAMDLVLASRESATVGLLDGSAHLEVSELVDQLYDNRRLTPTIVLRALCMGDLTFFEAALAKMAGIPVVNAYKLIHLKGHEGISRLFQKAKIPAKAVPLAEAALAVSAELAESAGDDRERFKVKMLERVLTQFEDEFDGEHLNYLIGKLTPRDEKASAAS